MTTWTGTIPTFTAGDTTTVTGNLNTLRDALKAQSEAWTSYTPTWTGSTTNPVLNNGSWSGTGYMQVGKKVEGLIVLTMGTTTTYGSGQWRITLPVTPVSSARIPFMLDMLDVSGGAAWTGKATWRSAGYLALDCQPTTAGNADRTVTSTTPFTWASTDQLVIPFSYQAA